MTKVLHIINDLNCGGAENLLLRICSGVKTQNPDISFSVIIIQENYQLLDQFKENEIPVLFIPVYTVSNWKRPFLLAKAIKKLQPDVVHTHLLKADRIGQVAAWLAGVSQRYCTVHSCEAYKNFQDYTTRKITGIFATKIIAVSEAVKQYSIVNKFYPLSKIITIYNAPSFTAKAYPAKKEYNTPLRIVNVGRLTIAKNQKILLKTISILKSIDFNVSLRIVGEGEERSKLEKEIKKLNISDSVFLVGRSNEIEKELCNADIFVSTSAWEGFGMALVEAASVGLPIVATDIPAHREILGDTYPGLVKEENIAQKIIDFSKKSPEELSTKLLERAKKFSFEKMIVDYNELYSKL